MFFLYAGYYSTVLVCRKVFFMYIHLLSEIESVLRCAHGKRKLLCIPKFQIFCYIEFSQRQSLHIRV